MPKQKGAQSVASTIAAKSTSPTKLPAHRARLLGRLANLMSMPKDIFIEICFHLFPIDLLHLSWSSKGLRSILMSKSAQYIWRAARESQLPTLPPCPHDLTEPWYTALLFSAACQLCGRRKVQYKHFSLRISHCKPCYPKYVIPAHKINRNYPASDRHIARKLFNVLSDTYAPHGVICNSKKLDKSFREYKALDNEYDRHKLLESCKRYTTEVQNHARKVEKWQSEQARVKEAQDKEISEARWESIQAKLEVLGWEKRDFPFPGHEEWLKLTRKPQPLNDRVWKELYPQLEPILQLQKRNRLELEEDKRRSFRASRIWELYRLFIKNHPGDYFYPKSILVYPSFTKIRDMDDAHGTIDALWEASIGEIEEDLRCCTETIMQEARNWYGRCIETEMGSNSADGTDKSMVSIQRHLDMTLVTSVFQCSRCDEPLWLATFIHHSHITEKCCQYKRQGKAPGDVSTDLLDVNCLRYNPGLQALMMNLLVGAGYDPLSCTVADFVLAPWNLYSCERCEKDYQLPLKFKELVSHYVIAWSRFKPDSRSKENTDNVNVHDLNNTELKAMKITTFRKLDEEEAEMVRGRNASFMAPFRDKSRLPRYRNNEYWYSYYGSVPRCRLCDYCSKNLRGDSVGPIVTHLKIIHGIEVDTSKLDGST